LPHPCTYLVSILSSSPSLSLSSLHGVRSSSVRSAPLSEAFARLAFGPLLTPRRSLVQRSARSPISGIRLTASGHSLSGTRRVDVCSSLSWHSSRRRLLVPVRHSSRRRLLVPVGLSSRRRLIVPALISLTSARPGILLVDVCSFLSLFPVPHSRPRSCSCSPLPSPFPLLPLFPVPHSCPRSHSHSTPRSRSLLLSRSLLPAALSLVPSPLLSLCWGRSLVSPVPSASACQSVRPVPSPPSLASACRSARLFLFSASACQSVRLSSRSPFLAAHLRRCYLEALPACQVRSYSCVARSNAVHYQHTVYYTAYSNWTPVHSVPHHRTKPITS